MNELLTTWQQVQEKYPTMQLRIEYLTHGGKCISSDLVEPQTIEQVRKLMEKHSHINIHILLIDPKDLFAPAYLQDKIHVYDDRIVSQWNDRMWYRNEGIDWQKVIYGGAK